MAKRHEQAFQEETNKHVKRCSTSLVIKGTYNKTTMRDSETILTCQTARKLLQSLHHVKRMQSQLLLAKMEQSELQQG